MTERSCDELLQVIGAQFGSKFSSMSTSFGCEVRTPLLYPDNSPIMVTVEPIGEAKYLVSDKGAASDFAFLSGVSDLAVSERIDFSERRFRLTSQGDEITTEVVIDNVADGILRVALAVLDVGYLIYKNQKPARKKEFQVEVQEFLVSRRRRYKKDIPVQGSTGMRHVDFHVLPDGMQQLNFWILDTAGPSVAIKRAENIAFAYVDIEKAGEAAFAEFAALVRIDPAAASQKQEAAVKVLENYLPRIVRWDDPLQLERFISPLAA